MQFFPFWLFLFLLFAGFFSIAKYYSLYTLLFGRKAFDIERDYVTKPKVSVMMSCFKEGEQVYQSIISLMESDYPRDKLEVIAFDDASPDDSYEWMLKAQALYPDNVIVKKNPQNLGKCFTLVEISKIATGDIFISVDSDALFDRDAIKHLISAFKDSDVGAVGAQIRIKNVNDTLLTQYQSILYVRVYYFYKPIENLFKTARCHGGPMVAFRREIYLKMMEYVVERNFLGEIVTYGEDTYLTALMVFGQVFGKSWKMFTDIKAICWVGTPTSWSAYINQQLRWRRGTVENGLEVLVHFCQKVRAGGIAAALINIIPMISILLMLMLGLFLFICGMFLQSLMLGVIAFFTFTLFTSWVYNLTIGRTDPMGKLKNPIAVAFAAAVWFPVNMYWLTIVAACTMDDGGWVTRQKASNTG